MPPKSDFPDIPTVLLNELSRIYPDRCPFPGEKLEDIWYKSGQRSVIAFLQKLHEKQNETILAGK